MKHPFRSSVLKGLLSRWWALKGLWCHEGAELVPYGFRMLWHHWDETGTFSNRALLEEVGSWAVSWGLLLVLDSSFGFWMPRVSILFCACVYCHPVWDFWNFKSKTHLCTPPPKLFLSRICHTGEKWQICMPIIFRGWVYFHTLAYIKFILNLFFYWILLIHFTINLQKWNIFRSLVLVVNIFLLVRCHWHGMCDMEKACCMLGF